MRPELRFPEHPHKGRVWRGHLTSWCLWGEDTQILGVCWLASLAETLNSRSSERPCVKKVEAGCGGVLF